MKQPIPTGWPKGKLVALSVNVMMESWTPDAVPGSGPTVAPLRAGVFDSCWRAWGDYGEDIGAWRILELFDSLGIKACFYTSGIVAQDHPELVAAVAKSGHHVCSHAWAQNMIPALYESKEAELADLKKTVALIEKVTGSRPRGYVSPRGTASRHTAELLAANGFAWTADNPGIDLPKLRETPGGPIVAMPFTFIVNDLVITGRYGQPPREFVNILTRALDEWPNIPSPHACLDISVHSHVFGRPTGIIELKNAILEAQKREWAWLTNHAEVAKAAAPQLWRKS